ncbi:c-type cytochrome [Terriglobus saanensis]|uniref:Cytochrome c class I n=1 Tax=Terriglobus saanensis (strain ATCC BAA-1853 / DSM 23119 / SP1PR4) TaxID=401053 RepID=E8V132_TERSS|nr:cytochrome c [Terriglobus saanensis]ADV83380.1 cytochrome c class I [Terriglobus saanensis SP1PR4]
MRNSLTAFAAICMVGLAGCKANPPSKLETKTITFAKHHVFVGNKKQKNPLPYTHENWDDGKEAFSHYCIACHGMDGQNTGIPFADHISPPIPSLASEDVQRYTDGQLKWILDNGIRPSGMPGSKGTLSDDELWSIVVFLRHLPPAGSQGVPEIYTH